MTYAIGTHSDEPMSFILFLAIKKEKTRINIPNNLGIIFTRKNIKKEILSCPISRKIELPISSKINEKKFNVKIVIQKPFLSKLPSLDIDSHFNSMKVILTQILDICMVNLIKIKL